MNKQEVLQREFLLVRAKVLEIAACLDRIDRAEGDLPQNHQRELLSEAIGHLLGKTGNRAEQIQLLFSREYSDQWRSEFQL
ncbi:hypothetical protein [Adhaeretor mobilis]|uniref:Uncharacterized protein n=1 Tax=Adhaeretor mobilis TaxID=1930276 RepID=A0A517MXR4_9BACT|nr:hypothetical protein [Adhaeretor mobilis]QDS99659.1 hypothetical protein HG15A2_29860 [Adhaeretor mobilis]